MTESGIPRQTLLTPYAFVFCLFPTFFHARGLELFPNITGIEPALLHPYYSNHVVKVFAVLGTDEPFHPDSSPYPLPQLIFQTLAAQAPVGGQNGLSGYVPDELRQLQGNHKPLFRPHLFKSLDVEFVWRHI
jgi:hypothetical protein